MRTRLPRAGHDDGRRRIGWLLTGAITSAMLSGCAVTQIPVGQWRGEGTFYEYESLPINDGKNLLELPFGRQHDGKYTTTLTISKVEYFKTACLLMEIESAQDQLYDAPYRHPKLTIVLVPRETLPNGCTPYAIATMKLNDPLPKLTEEEFHKSPAVPLAISYSQGDTLALEINYAVEESFSYSDTFLFSTSRVRKIGRLFGAAREGKPGVQWDQQAQVYRKIHWVEDMQRVR